jgi:hypothetical protein
MKNRLAEHERRFDAIREQVASLLDGVRSNGAQTTPLADETSTIAIMAAILKMSGNGNDLKHAKEACDLFRTVKQVWGNQEKVIEAVDEAQSA